ncbi:MAG: alpha-amylase family glycosyl hydrolase, partial [Ferruginibacter sp.]
EFGDDNDFKELVDAAHALQIKVIIDWVANHTAWDNNWTISNPDFFVKDGEGNFKAPYDWDDVIQVDHSNKEQQEAMITSMRYWVVNFDIDGFRADLAHLTPLPFWKKARQTLDELKPGLIWLAETEEPSYHEAFDISYTWEWMHACEKFVKNEMNVHGLIDLLKRQGAEFPEHAQRLYFTSNHDENSWNGTEYEKFGKLAKAFAVFSSTYDGIPLIYSGQENPNLKRLKFFDKDEIEWNEKMELQGFYTLLNDLRINNKAISGQVIFLENLAENNILAFHRRLQHHELIVILNLGDIEFTSSIPVNSLGVFTELFTNEFYFVEKNHLNISIPAAGFLVLEKK